MNPDPAAYLPHRPPFLFLDRLCALEPGVSACAELNLCSHQPFPPLFLLEAMAQLGGIAAGQREGDGGVLAAVRGVRLPARLPEDATLFLTSEVVKAFGTAVQIRGEVRERDELIASALITLASEGRRNQT